MTVETSSPAAPAETAGREMVLTRVFDAPRELVFQAFTDPAHLPHWYGPHFFSNTVHAIDVRPGGVFRYTMHGPDGTDWPNRISYREITRPERIVYDHGEDVDDDPNAFHVTVTFSAEDGGTRVTMRTVFNTAEQLAAAKGFGAEKLGYQTLERLAERLKAMAAGTLPPAEGGAGRDFVVTREVDAPRALVFDAWTKEEHLKHWWGPKGFTMLSCRVDLRPGGMFLYGMRSPEGYEMWGRWVYREISPPDRLTFVSSFSDKEGAVTRAPFSASWPLEVFSVLELTEHGGRTTVAMRGLPENATEAERKVFEAAFASMQQGWAGTLDQLEAYVANMGGGQ